ncbi:hypothetical protein BSKO_02725 [Bryopsis sp. KO-2023]|nr:hypothetical protein BSKO_02725 [Bryopsis sp. KO-2023]
MPLEVGLRIDRVVPFMTVGGILQTRRFLATMDTSRDRLEASLNWGDLLQNRDALGEFLEGVEGTVAQDESYVGTGYFVIGDGWAVWNSALGEFRGR